MTFLLLLFKGKFVAMAEHSGMHFVYHVRTRSVC